ncbi:PREDICTED: interleukin-12 receptor subunit beta-2 [Sturnus vulgaris]|uniref:interleukin-12 receptor subunit beta-2 n=1 Tax=Sturnus vulgaris TaxID=9172 RepID=UPI00071A6DFF|nr:PREDICTED: interleukin-12 receptor subunit beta-2 [Sturnus vulgaris]
MPFAWIVLSAICFVLQLTAESCRRGAVSASRAALATTELCAMGNVTASTSSAIQRGTNVTLWCQLAAPQRAGCCWAAIFLNSSEQVRKWGRSVRKTFEVTAYGKHTFMCKRICGEDTSLLCGIDIWCGNPPDKPRNVSCVQYGTRGHLTCTWDKGRLTYLQTDYTLELSNGTDAFCFPAEFPNQAFFSRALTKLLDFHSNYTVVVSASNELGNASSQPLTFTLIDIVKPNPPEFLVEFDDSSASSCSILWQGEAQAQHYRLRYRPLSRHSWSMVEIFSKEKFQLQGLEPDTEYEFQVSCRILPGRGLWSDWSRSQSRTPAAVPTGILDVWYRQQDLDSEHQNLSLFWKALSKSEAGGTILGYTVTLEALEHGELPAQCHQTTRTSFSRVTPRLGHRVTVRAHNPRGSSAPAAIVTHLGSPDLPPPERVSALGLGNSSILVSWSPPAAASVPVGGYVVEWAEPHLQPWHTWVKLPPSHLSTVIAEHIRDNLCYHIHVSALYQARAGQAASVRGNSTAQAPSAGPQMFTIPWARGVLVSWEEIPAPQQRGCITAYHIYVHRRARQGQPELHAIPAGISPLSLPIPDLQPGERHDLWMTAATAAGEGPRGNSDSVVLESARGWVTLVLIICSFLILSACVCSVPPARKVFLSLLLPQWQSKAIPDPANATWAKSLAATKAELSAPSNPFLPCPFEEPETSPVEETEREKTSVEEKTSVDPESPIPGEMIPGGMILGDKQQLPGLYRRLLLEAMEPGIADP